MTVKDPSFYALVQLGEALRKIPGKNKTPMSVEGVPWGDLESLLEQTYQQNAWFTRESCLFALNYWGEALKEASLTQWLANYKTPEGNPLRVALIMAGNIPLVGFHDLISVLLTGNSAEIKCASKDTLLLKYLVQKLTDHSPELRNRISFTEGKLGPFDAVIATGSTNTSRYFEYYFSKKPNIIRKNRHGVAVLTGAESPGELAGLAEDVFRYFGMGCRSVSKLFVPKGYDFDPLFNAFFRFKHLIDHQKYGNNYDYNKAVFLMGGSPMLDNGFLLLKEDQGLGSPIGTLFYETYDERETVIEKLKASEHAIQCIVGGSWLPRAVPFGNSQKPELATYADGVDTVDFLLKTSSESTALH